MGNSKKYSKISGGGTMQLVAGIILLIAIGVLITESAFEKADISLQIRTDNTPGAQGGDSTGTQKSNASDVPKNTAQDILEGYEISAGWTITSYQNIDEKLYRGGKVEVFDEHGKSLGFYREDFLRQVKIDGSGIGDGAGNPGTYLHYDYEIDDGKTHYLADKSLGAYLNELVPWTGARPSVAVNPPVPHGTEIVFVDLGQDSKYLQDWVHELLLSKTFYADDKFHGWDERKVDIYVGMQKSLEHGAESLLLRNVTIAVKYPE
ncbi:MAG: hypothetical protein ACP5E4_01590 [Candidatus Aenigmatarchaeota archaeon]